MCDKSVKSHLSQHHILRALRLISSTMNSPTSTFFDDNYNIPSPVLYGSNNLSPNHSVSHHLHDHVSLTTSIHAATHDILIRSGNAAYTSLHA